MANINRSSIDGRFLRERALDAALHYARLSAEYNGNAPTAERVVDAATQFEKYLNG